MARMPKIFTDADKQEWVICHDMEWVPIMSRRDEAYGIYYYPAKDPSGPRLLVARDEVPAFDFSTDWIEVPPYPLGDDNMTNSVDKLKEHKRVERRIVDVLHNKLKANGETGMYSVVEWKVLETVAGAVSVEVMVNTMGSTGMTSVNRKVTLFLAITDFDECFQ